MFNENTIQKFQSLETPFYYYNLDLLQKTIEAIKQANKKNYHIHYALKANANPKILNLIKEAGFGADCVSGNEVKRAVEIGFKSSDIVFAGVGKSDKEINFALDNSIFCFNVESIHELQVLNELAKNKNVKANIALRINPNVDAHTHKYITTGLEENKFGINPYEFEQVFEEIKKSAHLNFIGLHFHIGSQIQDLSAFKNLCLRVNEINKHFIQQGFFPQHLNLGGGLGVNYTEPDTHAIVDFESYFNVFRDFLETQTEQHIHFELGRCIVAQCGSLISRVLYIKKGINTNFAILDAGMTELLRPALYQAFHKIENLSNPNGKTEKYDVVGPICESSDCFGKALMLPEMQRGNLIAIRSAGAYGEVMSSRYNLRDEVVAVF
ncbi:MAG: diaminopimelate decarboxylase [Bacteroidetes bacterium]|nr:diaminopimelate decarboxylase [Bacteroidota bacterium]